MPNQVKIRITRIYLRWIMPNQGKKGLFLFVEYKNQKGHITTARQCIFTQFYNPEGIDKCVRDILMKKYLTPVEIEVPKDATATIELPENHATAQILCEPSQIARQFKPAKLGIDLDSRD